MTEKSRVRISQKISQYEKTGKLYTKIMVTSAENIDYFGIKNANKIAMQSLIHHFQRLFPDCNFRVFIDGADNYIFPDFPEQNTNYHFAKKRNARSKNSDIFKEICPTKNQQMVISFVIRGDFLHPIISAASVLAKVHRDRIMEGISADFPEYNLAKNKGYGTRKHHDAILYYGIKNIHRKTYSPMKDLIS